MHLCKRLEIWILILYCLRLWYHVIAQEFDSDKDQMIDKLTTNSNCSLSTENRTPPTQHDNETDSTFPTTISKRTRQTQYDNGTDSTFSTTVSKRTRQTQYDDGTDSTFSTTISKRTRQTQNDDGTDSKFSTTISKSTTPTQYDDETDSTFRITLNNSTMPTKYDDETDSTFRTTLNNSTMPTQYDDGTDSKRRTTISKSTTQIQYDNGTNSTVSTIKTYSTTPTQYDDGTDSTFRTTINNNTTSAQYDNGTDSTFRTTITTMISNSDFVSEDPHLSNATLLSSPNQTNQKTWIQEIEMKFQYVHNIFLIPCLTPFGIIGNSIVAHTLVLKNKSNTANRYMITILITDVISLIIDLLLPVATVLAQSDVWSVKEIAAQMHYYAADVSSFLCRRFNLNVFCVLSFERLIAITKPFRIHQSVTVKKFQLFLITSFLVAIVQTLPSALFKIQPIHDDIEDYTSFVAVKRSDMILVSENTEFWISHILNIIDGPIQIVFFTFINILIVRAMRNRKISAAVASGTTSDQGSNHQKKLVKIFLLLSVTNTLAFLTKAVGYVVYTVMERSNDGRVSSEAILLVGGSHFLRVLNSGTDFIVFVAASTEIRNDTKKIIKCTLRKQNFIAGHVEARNNDTCL